MARLAEAVRQLAHDLHADEPLGEAGVLNRLFEELQHQQLIRVKIETASVDSTIVKVHPDGTGRKKRPTIDRSIPWRMDDQNSYGCRGCSNGSDLLALSGPGARCAGRSRASEAPLWGYRDAAGSSWIVHTKATGPALDLGFIPVVPPTVTRVSPWRYRKAWYRRRNEIERLFRRLKGFRDVGSRFDNSKSSMAFLSFALIVEALLVLTGPS